MCSTPMFVRSNEIWTIFVMCICSLFHILFPLSIFSENILLSNIYRFSCLSWLCVSQLIRLYWKLRNTRCIEVIRIVCPLCSLTQNIFVFKIYGIFRKHNIDVSLSANTIWRKNFTKFSYFIPFPTIFFPYCWIVPRNLKVDWIKNQRIRQIKYHIFNVLTEHSRDKQYLEFIYWMHMIHYGRVYNSIIIIKIQSIK